MDYTAEAFLSLLGTVVHGKKTALGWTLLGDVFAVLCKIKYKDKFAIILTD